MHSARIFHWWSPFFIICQEGKERLLNCVATLSKNSLDGSLSWFATTIFLRFQNWVYSLMSKCSLMLRVVTIGVRNCPLGWKTHPICFLHPTIDSPTMQMNQTAVIKFDHWSKPQSVKLHLKLWGEIEKPQVHTVTNQQKLPSYQTLLHSQLLIRQVSFVVGLNYNSFITYSMKREASYDIWKQP